MKGNVTWGLVWTSAMSNLGTVNGDWAGAGAQSSGIARSRVRDRTIPWKVINDLGASNETGEREGENRIPSHLADSCGSMRVDCQIGDGRTMRNDGRCTGVNTRSIQHFSRALV